MTLKKIIVLFFLSLPFFSSGQDKKLFDVLPVADGKVNYHDTVYLSNKSSEDLKARITKWYADSYAQVTKGSDHASMDQHSYYFVIKWKQPVWSKYPGANNLKVNVWYSVSLTAFENGYYYEITNFKIKRYERKSFLKPFPSYVDVTVENINSATTDEKAKIVCNEIDKQVREIVSLLKEFMKS